MNKILKERREEIEKIAKEELELDYFPLQYEMVPWEVMLEVASYGLPTRARHWSHGQIYNYQKITQEMGFSKIYELILNGDPAPTFLLENNNDIDNTLVMAHVVGHSFVFKNNFMFKGSDRKMAYHSAVRAARVDDYIRDYGLDRVEHIMDIGFALEKHIDWRRGLYRDPYPKKRKVLRRNDGDEFSDLLDKGGSPGSKVVYENSTFPPHHEYDILWFLINYAELEDWERDVLQIIREESFYFYPQSQTKIVHEGFASWTHAEILYRMTSISEKDYLEFSKTNERVVQPGASKLNINPYFLGYVIFEDIRNRWDEKFKNGESNIDGLEKIKRVASDENDISFVKNYLTQELVDELGMITYKTFFDSRKNEWLQIESTDVEDVAENIVKDKYTYNNTPEICIVKADTAGLELEHLSTGIGTLDLKHLEKVLGYLYELWGAPVDIRTEDDEGGETYITYDELGLGVMNEAVEVEEEETTEPFGHIILKP